MRTGGRAGGGARVRFSFRDRLFTGWLVCYGDHFLVTIETGRGDVYHIPRDWVDEIRPRKECAA
jgi:hypothetical protein